MAEQIIRQDIVQVEFDVDYSGVTKIDETLNKVKKSCSNVIDNGLDKFDESLKKVNKSVAGLGNATKETSKKADKMKSSFSGIDDSVKTVSRATQKFQAVNRAIEDGGNSLKKFKSSIKSIPSKNIDKLSTGLIKIKMQSAVALGALKQIPKVKFQNLKTDVNATAQALKQGEKGGKGFVNMLKSIGKISVNKVVTSITKAKKGLKDTKSEGDKAKTTLDKFAKTSLTKLQSGLSKVKTHLSTIASKAAGAAFTGLKKFASISFKTLLTGLGTAAVAIGKFANMASDLEETKNKVDVAFGSGLGNFDGSAKTVMDWSKNSTTAMGLAQQTALDTAALFGDMGTSMGLTKKKSAEMSMALTQQAADLASFKNMSIDEVTTALNGVFTGETESLKRLGVVMTQANLAKFAGVDEKTLKAMSESEKVLLRYRYVMEKTKNATGDYERTGGGYANQLRTLTENFKQLGAIIGQLPMKKLAAGMKVVNDGLAKIQNILSDGFQDGDMDKIMDIVNGLIDKGINAISEGIPKILPKVLEILETIAKSLVKAIPKFAPALAEGVVSLMIGLGKIVYDNRHLLVNAAVKVVQAVVKAIYEGFTGKEMDGGMLDGLKNKIKGLTGVIGGLAAAFLAFKGATKAVNIFQKVKGLFGAKGGGGSGGGSNNLFTSLANLKTTTILKGLGNLAIILGGLTALTAAFMAVAPHISKLSDTKTVFKVIGIVGTLGVVGSVLAKLAGIVGLIPITVVAKGLAGIAIVLGGMTAIVAAFGALSKIPHFNEFIEKGGDTLANLFKQIGKIGGALIGGLGEGITGSLPKIGENLSAFAKSLKPMFNAFSGIGDMSNLGVFFKSLGSFMLTMAGNDLLSIFTGGTDLPQLGTDLTNFATNSADFFTKVKDFPKDGFTKAKQLFACLAGMKSLPKEGGVFSWFTGNVNYESLANGLGKLSSEKVKNFFAMVSELKGFKNATKLFDCLAGMKSLPQEGGVFSWFTGDVNYENISKGLGKLAGKGVKSFFKMVGGIEQVAFDNAPKLFEALAGIEKLPTEGGFFKKLGDKVLGEETKSQFGFIADELSNFSEKTETFFKQIEGLNLKKINGLWNSLKKSEEVTESVSKVVDENISTMVEKISEMPKKMGDGIKSSGKSLSDAFVSIWTDAVKATVAPVNKLLSGANWILKQFGSEKRVISWTPYAKGTDGHKGGNALVNDGRGAEMVQMPNGNTFIPKGRNVFIPNAPKGMKVLPADRTAQLMGKKSPTFRYADGVGNIDIWDYIDNPKGLISSVSSSYVNYEGMSGIALNIGKGMVSTISGEMTSWAKKLFDEMGALSLSSYVPSKGVEQWRSTVIRALKMEGQYSAANVARTLYQMQTESGGNPYAINLWDSNAKKGTPSKGLMQVIDPTFRAYARQGFNKNIYDPLSNILASVRYAMARYGSLARAYRGVGYKNGGLVTKTGVIAEQNKPEMVIPMAADKRSRAIDLWQKTGKMLGLSAYTPAESTTYTTHTTVEQNTYSPQFNLTISGTNDDRTMARKVKQWVDESMQEAFEGMGRRNPKTREV